MSQRYQTVKNTSTKRLVIVDLISDLPETAITSTLYFVREGRRLYVYSDNGPIPIVTENDIPSWVDVPGSNNVVLLDNVFIQRLSFDDPEQILGVFSFTVSDGSVNANNDVEINNEVFSIKSNTSASFTIRFSGTDGANEITALSEFILRQEEWASTETFRLATESTPNSYLGTSSALNNDFVFSGAPGVQKVVVYKKDTNNINRLTFHQELTPSASSPGFGTSIASDGDYLVVGAPTAVSNNGQVWLYKYNTSSDIWEETDSITITASGQSGTSVDISNGIVIVGGPASNRVDLYSVAGDQFGTSFPLTSTNITGIVSGDRFGQSVAIDVRPSGTVYVAVGSPGDEGNTGSAYNVKLSYNVISVPQFDIEDQTKLLGQYSGPGDEFGFSIDVLEYEIAVGAPNNDLNNLNSGIVYVFKENPLNGDWNETDTLLTGNANSNSLFGSSVRFNRNVLYPGGKYIKSILAGAQLDSGSGRVYSFKYNTSNNRYVEHRVISDENGSSSDFFGKSIDVQNNSLVVGASGTESLTGLVNNVGNVHYYVLEKDENAPQFTRSTFTSYLKQGTTETYNIEVTHPRGLDTTLFIYSVNNIDIENVSIVNGVLSVSMPSDAEGDVTVAVGAEDDYGRINLQENTFIPTNTDNIEITSSNTFNPETGTYTVTVNNPSAEIYSVSAIPKTNISENQIAVSGNTITINDLVQDQTTPLSFRAIVETGANGYIDYLDITTSSWSSPTRQAKIQSDDIQAGDNFGYSVAIDGDTVIVGARFEDTGGDSAGAAYIFTRSGSTWTQQAKIQSSDIEAGDQLGYSVAIDGDTAIVGAPFEDTGGLSAGAAYIFTRSGSTWTQQAKIQSSDIEADNHFGWSVAISGDTAIVGAFGENTLGTYTGAAYIFTRSGSTWTQQAKIQSSDIEAGDRFGSSVAIDGDTVIVGAHLEDTGAGSVGAAYIFTRSGSTWTQQAKIQASDRESNDQLGYSVAISGDTAIVGAINVDTGGSDAGSAYIFTRDGTTWTQQAKIQSSDIEAGDQFGWSVAISGDTAIVGANFEDTGGSNAGSAYIFTRLESTWTQQAKIQSDDPYTSDFFGNSVAISGSTAIVGSRLEETDQLSEEAGFAHIFTKG